MVKETLEVLNLWWKEKKVSKELAKPYKRHVFKKLLCLIEYRQIVILSGLRRVGKTTLLYQLIEFLLEKVNATKILYFNFDKRVEELIKILNAYQEITGENWKKEKIYCFLDEISKLKDWASQLKLIYDAFPNIKFVISSSSSVALEAEAIKNLTGRYFLVNIMPLSFREYLEIKEKKEFIEKPELWKEELRKELSLYLIRSFPEIVTWQNEFLIKDYLRSMIIDKIIKEDLPEKFKNVNKELLLNLLEIFYTNPGMILDYESISKKFRISKKTLLQHIFFLEFSYLIRRIRNFRPSIFASSRKLQKVYPWWWTLAYCYTSNYDKIMENLVASIVDAKYYWRKDGKEIDFLLVKEKNIILVEVKNKPEVPKNELQSIKYFLAKYKAKEIILIYNGEESEEKIKDKKIKFVPLWKWLLE